MALVQSNLIFFIVDCLNIKKILPEISWFSKNENIGYLIFSYKESLTIFFNLISLKICITSTKEFHVHMVILSLTLFLLANIKTNKSWSKLFLKLQTQLVIALYSYISMNADQSFSKFVIKVWFNLINILKMSRHYVLELRLSFIMNSNIFLK